MTITSTATQKDIDVRVVPRDDIQIQVDAKLPAGHKPILKALITYGAAAELGPSDHVPSYSPGPDDNHEFRVDIREGEASGGLLLVAGDILWTAVFHRFKLAGGVTAWCAFADQDCTLEIQSAPHTSVVLLRSEMQRGPAGEPCYVYSVTGKSNALQGKKMALHFSLSGQVEPSTLKAYQWSSANGWIEAPDLELSEDKSQLQLPIQVNHTYAISGQ
jgi:hypothetical protein